MRVIRLLGLGLAILTLSVGTALAFHDGGVAYCAGCHTMHNSQDGAPIDTVNVGGNAYLLIAGNSSDTCLSCHAAYGQFAEGLGYGPGGDFYWLTKTYTWTSHGHENHSEGDSHGHNVISPAYGLTEDQTLSTAPGGDFMASRLTCTSCHDPHGNQNFRLLYGSELGPVYNGTRYDFDEDAPLAVGNSRRTIAGTSGEETNSQHTVYKSGMSAWCSNCHRDFHSGTAQGFVHPTGQMLGTTVANIYNAYVSSDSLNVSGNEEHAYWGLTPFEDIDADLATVDPGDYTAGPVSGDRVMCLSCHRSHASAFPDAGRWDFHATFMNEDSHPKTGDGGLGANDVENSYYGYEFVENQRSLCNKCHVKDEFDAPFE